MNTLYVRVLLLTLIALMLSIFPAPAILNGFRPPWICLLTLYLQFYFPRYIHVIFILILGLCLDVLLSTVFGEHALALLLITWIASTKIRRFQFFPLGQRMVLIGVFCLMYQSIIMAIDAFLSFHYVVWTPLTSAAVAMILWPWIQFFAHYLLLIAGNKPKILI